MIRASLVGALAVCGLIAAPCLAADPTPEKHQGVGRVYDKDAGLSIVPPPGWAPVKNADAAFMTFKQPQSDGIANVNVRWVKYTGSPLGQIADALKVGMPKKFKDWKCVAEGQPTIDGKKCYYIVSRYSTQFNGQPLELQSVQYLIPTDHGRAYIVTCTSATTMFDSLKRSFEVSAGTARTD